jgi:hypothetical protein
MIELLTDGPKNAETCLVLAHGAGAPMTSPWLSRFAELLAGHGLGVLRFEFAYMAARRTGARKPPPRAEALTSEYLAVVDQVFGGRRTPRRLLIGGKSLGGRVASLVADELLAAGRIRGLVCLGYPFHPPKKPEQLRTKHLATLACPALIAQGERDPFGTTDEVTGYALSPSIRLHWARDGDHDLAPRKSSGVTLDDNLSSAAGAVAAFCLG